MAHCTISVYTKSDQYEGAKDFSNVLEKSEKLARKCAEHPETKNLKRSSCDKVPVSIAFIRIRASLQKA